MTEYVYAKHSLCATDLEWQRCGLPPFEGAEPTLDLWCPACNRRVERDEISLQGALSAMLRETKES